jgi:hypothetical protein
MVGNRPERSESTDKVIFETAIRMFPGLKKLDDYPFDQVKY